jgi:hypothetical protein
MGSKGQESVTIDAHLVSNINKTIIELCERYVYSKTRSEQVRQLVNEAANTRQYGVNVFLPLGMTVPTAKDFVLHMMRLAPWPFPAWLADNWARGNWRLNVSVRRSARCGKAKFNNNEHTNHELNESERLGTSRMNSADYDDSSAHNKMYATHVNFDDFSRPNLCLVCEKRDQHLEILSR